MVKWILLNANTFFFNTLCNMLYLTAMYITDQEKKFLEIAIELARQGMIAGYGGPFGCVIVKDSEIIGQGANMVIETNDPTAHAEIVAIRQACRKLGNYQLTGSHVYASCEPCPMCLGAIYWARPERVVYANTRQEAAAIQFDDAFIYEEINMDFAARQIPFIHYPHLMATEVFETWKNFEGRKLY